MLRGKAESEKKRRKVVGRRVRLREAHVSGLLSLPPLARDALYGTGDVDGDPEARRKSVKSARCEPDERCCPAQEERVGIAPSVSSSRPSWLSCFASASEPRLLRSAGETKSSSSQSCEARTSGEVGAVEAFELVAAASSDPWLLLLAARPSFSKPHLSRTAVSCCRSCESTRSGDRRERGGSAAAGKACSSMLVLREAVGDATDTALELCMLARPSSVREETDPGVKLPAIEDESSVLRLSFFPGWSRLVRLTESLLLPLLLVRASPSVASGEVVEARVGVEE